MAGISLAYWVMLALALVLLVAAEWPRLERLARRGRSATPRAEDGWHDEDDRLGRQRRAERRQEADDFAASVLRDLDDLPTTDEDEARR